MIVWRISRHRHTPILPHDLGQERYWNRGYLGARQLLEKHRPRIDAILAYDDPVAMGVIKYPSDNGIRVPDSVAVVGFDHQPEAEYSIPPLTSIHQPVDEIRRRSVELMKRMLQQQAPPEQLLVPTELVGLWLELLGLRDGGYGSRPEGSVLQSTRSPLR